MHSLLKWKEVPIDVLLLAIYRLQLYFLKEIKRGKAGIGSYALRAEQSPYAITVQEITDLTVCPPENIIESIKNKTLAMKGEGSHWLMLSTLDCRPRKEVKIYDSAYESVSFYTQEIICNLIKFACNRQCTVFSPENRSNRNKL